MSLLQLPNMFNPEFGLNKKPSARYEIDYDNPLTRGLYKAEFFEGGNQFHLGQNVILSGINAKRTLEGLETQGTSTARYPIDTDNFPSGVGSAIFDFERIGRVPSSFFTKLLITKDAEWQISRAAIAGRYTIQVNKDLDSFLGMPDIMSTGRHKLKARWDTANNFRRTRS